MIFKHNQLIKDILDLEKQPVMFSKCYCPTREGRKHGIQLLLVHNTLLLTKIKNDTH